MNNFICKNCGNIVNRLKEGKGEILCCGIPMEPAQGVHSEVSLTRLEFNTPDEVIDFAIKKEEEAYQFYTEWEMKLKSPGMKELFQELADEELRHKSRLLDIKKDKFFSPPLEKVQNLKISEYLSDVTPKEEMEYQDILILAMQREKRAFKIYTSLAELVEETNLRGTFLLLAQEEAKHKLRLEIEYDEYILADM